MPSLWVRKTLWFFEGLFEKKDLEKERKGKDEGETTSSKAQRRESLRGVKLKKAMVPTRTKHLGAQRDTAFRVGTNR
jgi:hypothetical protein